MSEKEEKKIQSQIKRNETMLAKAKTKDKKEMYQKKIDELKSQLAESPNVGGDEEIDDDKAITLINQCETFEQLDELIEKFPSDVPEEVRFNIEDKRERIKAKDYIVKNHSPAGDTSKLKWKECSIEDVLAAQREGRLVGHDPQKGLALIKPK